ncbi:threonine-phosphate decarboxylase CobD [Bacillus sp. 2205SS5-2]|uniref:threonine-phosphate decarboxylase CobD n=1 Tax=Bacillus sp. 2205SS5-2 TaxID=3109031 RepID=UPI00300444D2
MNWPEHGGQPAQMKKLFHLKKEVEVYDFSANLNPIGPPKWLKEEMEKQWQKLMCYPDPHYSSSRATLARIEDVDEDEILLTNGGAEAIFLVAKYFEGKRAGIVHPVFSEYERACRHYHLDVTDVLVSAEDDFQLPVNKIVELMSDIDVLFLCRPNNPTGMVVPKNEMKILLEQGLISHTYLVVDEAFVDFIPSESLGPLLKNYPNMVLLRSLTKMYTIPGLRLGYIMGGSRIVEVLKKEQIPWSVNAIADAVAPRLLEDKEFLIRTFEWLREQTDVLRTFYEGQDFYMSPTCVNFYLMQDQKNPNQMEELFNFLLRNGILARHTHNFKGLGGRFLRFSIRSEDENTKLLRLLRKWRERG